MSSLWALSHTLSSVPGPFLMAPLSLSPLQNEPFQTPSLSPIPKFPLAMRSSTAFLPACSMADGGGIRQRNTSGHRPLSGSVTVSRNGRMSW